MTLQTWIIEPRDSLIVRDGKPFGANITHATSLDFPFPSTTTGGVRTRAGLDTDGKFDILQTSVVKGIEVKGPLLVGLNPDTNLIVNFYLPSPADALLLQDDNQKLDNEFSIKQLLPIKIGNAKTNLPNDLMPVGIIENDTKFKPYTDLKFWSWQKLKDWLFPDKKIEKGTLKNYGIENLLKDSRTHVAINENLASKNDENEEGGLFSTHGLEFNYSNQKDLADVRKFALAVFVDEINSKKLENKANLSPLGGERRLVTWRKSEANKIESTNFLPLTCPPEIKKQIGKYCRLMLLTPAFFNEGLPKSNADYKVKAIACNRYQTVSGWDFAFTKIENGKTVNGQPKPTRRLLPAGSILFIEIKNDVEKFIQDTWFNCIGDDPQAKKDGFGLSILGTWDGNCLEMENVK